MTALDLPKVPELPKFTLIDNTPADLGKSRAEIIVVGTLSGEDGLLLAPGAEVVDTFVNGQLVDLLTVLGASGKADEVIKLAVPSSSVAGSGSGSGKAKSSETLTARVIVAAGLGKADDNNVVTAEQVRRAAGASARSLGKAKRVLSTLSTVDLQAAVEGTTLGGYSYKEYKSDQPDQRLSTVEFLRPAEGTTRSHTATLKAASAIAEAVFIARDLINTPPNVLYPESFADRAKELAESHGLDIKVLDEKALKRKGFGGIMGVGSGSARPPRLVQLTYRGPKAKQKVALVGKGVTFDTGGISLKPPANMENMTSDMSGAAVILGVMVLAAKLKYPLEITATLPLAENMPSGSSYRPGDVLQMYGGKTVEVLNTDAEGRLLLADAIAKAAEDKPDYLIETSTLTGAQLVALGDRTAAVMGSPEFRDRVAEIARATGEGGWAMPLPDYLRSELDSPLADIANHTESKWGRMLIAGVFLREFVPEQLPWVHIDVAGPAYNTKGARDYTTKGGTGVPLRTIAAVLSDIAEQSEG